MPGSLAEQERDAKELFGRADRVVPDTNSVVRLTLAFSRSHTSHTRRAEKACLETCDKAGPLPLHVAQTHGGHQCRQVFQGVP